MRNTLALFAAFTLSTSTAVSAVACESSDQTTVVIFDWKGIINENSRTSDDFFRELLANPDVGIGKSLYEDIVNYISLSILKTDTTFKTDYEFAKQAVENEIENTKNSLRAKYGRSWEKKWKDFLQDPARGGDGTTGSYQRYFDILLKSKANTIVSQYYVGDNYHNYQYYNSTEISIWLNDMYNKINSDKPGSITMAEYKENGIYKDKLWIVAASVTQNSSPDYNELETEINSESSASNIQLKYKVAKTKDDTPLVPGDNYLVDPSNTIKGLLSNQQAKIAQVWMKNQGPMWARQIVIPFNENEKAQALKKAIDENSFSDSKQKLVEIITTIKSGEGFEAALKNITNNITSVTSSAASGDLGLVTLNSNTSNIKASFSYYLYRYATSEQGIGQSVASTTPYSLSEYKANDPNDLSEFINTINRAQYAPTNNDEKHTSKYNDLVWMEDNDQNAKYSGNGGNKVAVFIDEDGIHFVQTPGITYTSSQSNQTTQEIITEYNQLISDNERKLTWDDVKKISDRPGGLTSNPYLNFLQTQYLLWNANNQTTYFDLNDSLKKFTTGSSDISSDIWWDYILYFNNNMNNLHWNLPEVLNTNVYADNNKIDKFINAMKSWVSTTFARRWSLHQGISNTDALIKNINDLNQKWDDYEPSPPIARLDAEDIKSYLNNVAGQTIWWYDSNSIQN